MGDDRPELGVTEVVRVESVAELVSVDSSDRGKLGRDRRGRPTAGCVPVEQHEHVDCPLEPGRFSSIERCAEQSDGARNACLVQAHPPLFGVN